MIESLLNVLSGECDAGRCRELLAALWEQERWFDAPHQRQAAEVGRDFLASAGLADVRIVPFPADGRARFQDWTTHLAWRCSSARLSLGECVLADRAACPTAVVQWSGPLPPTTAPVVDGDSLGTIRPEDVRGRFVLTAQQPRMMKQRLLGTGALAVVSDFLGPNKGYDADTTRWCNAWGDGPDGWYFRAVDQVMPGFCLSPRQGALLRQSLSGDPVLQLTVHCDALLEAGSSQCVTGLLPGRQADREVWLFAHAAEQGANDNCSGVCVIFQAVAAIARLVERGLLPRPRFGIRVIATEECIGMLAFAAQEPQPLKRAIVGLNADSVGDGSEEDRPFTVFYGPLSLPTFGWAVAGALGEALVERNRGAYHMQSRHAPPTADDMIADPACGVPTLWLGRGQNSVGYHSSADTPPICRDASLRCNCLLAAGWAYAMADMDDRLAESLIPAAARWIDRHVLAGAGGDAGRLRQWAGGRILRDLARWGVRASTYEPAASRYCPADAPPLDDLPTAGPRLARRTWGTCTLETLPPDRVTGLSRWSSWQAAALYWSHAGRPLPAVERLTRAEVGEVPPGGIEKLAEACVEAGLADR